jgi:PTS system N-acetylgalactosamine-specific IIA component
MVRALVVGHGTFASGIISAVEQITGMGSMLAAVPSGDHGVDGMMALVEEMMSNLNTTVVFTDLPAGSATMAMRRLQLRLPGMVVVSGTNLASLLDFVGSAGTDQTDATRARNAAETGRSSIVCHGGESVG